MKLSPSKWLEWERKIRGGNGSEVAAELPLVSTRGLSVEDRARLAALAARAGDPMLGVRLLHRVVRPRSSKPSEVASDDVTTSYSLCLLRIGAREEAVRLLSRIDPSRHPKVLLIQAAACTTTWNYSDAIPLLERFLRHARGYDAVVTRVNLAAALCYCERATEGRAVLSRLLHDTSLRKFRLLHANALELAAQLAVQSRQWEAADGYLEKARGLLTGASGRDPFFVDKWRAIAGSLKKEDPAPLEELRSAAVGRGHWETARDCDKYRALITHDKALFWRLYFGTPHPAYRESLLRTFSKRWKIPLVPPKVHRRTLGAGVGTTLDLIQGKADGVKLPPLIHRTLAVLARDAYAPTRTSELFRLLFPDELFNPDTYAHRVHEAIRRTRRWLGARRIRLSVEDMAGAYRIGGDSSLLLVLAAGSGDVAKPLVDRLLEISGGTPFAMKQILDSLHLPRRTLARALDRLVARGLIVRTGRGRSARYAWPISASSPRSR